jgi:hypothetical protein
VCLERRNEDILKSIEHHAQLIEKLLAHNTESIISFASIRQEIKSLCEKIDLGITFFEKVAKIFAVTFTIFIGTVGGVVAFQDKIYDKIESTHVSESKNQQIKFESSNKDRQIKFDNRNDIQ